MGTVGTPHLNFRINGFIYEMLAPDFIGAMLMFSLSRGFFVVVLEANHGFILTMK